jgi:transketolase
MLKVAPKLLKGDWSIEDRPASELEAGLAVAARFVRRHATAAIYHAGSGDPGAALSCAELLVCLYGAELNLWPSSVSDPDRDRFVLSKGEAAPALYATGVHYRFCDSGAALSLRKLGSKFQAHPHVVQLPFVETSTGSPGQGFSAALGMALGLKLQKRPSRVYALLGDRDLETGEAWETAMCAARHGLDNFCAIVDHSRVRSEAANDGATWLGPIAAKWRAFDWAVAEIDGHDIAQILKAFRRAGSVHDRPALIIAHTVKGKGVTAFEDAPAHHRSVPLAIKEAAEALADLGTPHKEISELLHGR